MLGLRQNSQNFLFANMKILEKIIKVLAKKHQFSQVDFFVIN
jgi:hypothetical protein